MSKKIIALSIVLFGVSVVSVAAEKSRPYAAIGLTNIKYDGPGLKFKNSLIEGRFGYNFTPYFAIEGRLATAANDDTVSGTTYEIDRYVGVYLRGNIPLNKSASLYGFAGITNVNGKVSGAGLAISVDDTDFGYGVGFNFSVSSKGSIGIEYLDLYSNNSEDISGFNVHYKHSF